MPASTPVPTILLSTLCLSVFSTMIACSDTASAPPTLTRDAAGPGVEDPDGRSGTDGGLSDAPTRISGATEVTDIVGVGRLAYFTGVEPGGEGAIFEVSTAQPNAIVLCKAGANRTLSALAAVPNDAHTTSALYAIRRDPDTGKSAIVKTTPAAHGGACEVVAEIHPHGFFTELAKVGDSLVYLGAEKVMKLPLAGGGEGDLVTSPASFIGDFAASGSIGFVVDTAAPAPAGARIARFTLGGAIETFVTVTSPQESGHEVIAGKVVWAEKGPSAGDFVFKSADATAPLPVTPTTVVASNFGIGSVLGFCRPNAGNPAELAVSAFNATSIDYHLVGSSSRPSRLLGTLASVQSPLGCALTENAVFAIDPDDKHVFWFPR